MEITDQTKLTEDVSITADTLASDTSRRAFLTKLAAGAAAATAVAAAPASAFASTGKLKFAGASVPASDGHILNFALTLEHLEARFYTVAANRFPHMGYVSQVIRTLRYDENQHVNALTAAIKSVGYTPVAAAHMYNFHGAFANMSNFLNTSMALEETGVHAYLGQAPNIKTTSILLTAASIVTVEARHTGAISAILKRNPTQGAFDKGLTEAQVLGIAGKFIG